MEYPYNCSRVLCDRAVHTTAELWWDATTLLAWETRMNISVVGPLHSHVCHGAHLFRLRQRVKRCYGCRKSTRHGRAVLRFDASPPGIRPSLPPYLLVNGFWCQICRTVPRKCGAKRRIRAAVVSGFDYSLAQCFLLRLLWPFWIPVLRRRRMSRYGADETCWSLANYAPRLILAGADSGSLANAPLNVPRLLGSLLSMERGVCVVYSVLDTFSGPFP